MRGEKAAEQSDSGKEVENVKKLDVVAAGLVIIGALNWGLVGFLNFDLVAAVFGRHFGETTPLSSVVYALVGLAGLYEAASLKAIVRRWGHSASMTAASSNRPITQEGR